MKNRRPTPAQLQRLAEALVQLAKVEECHIGWFDVEQCQAVVQAVQQRGTP